MMRHLTLPSGTANYELTRTGRRDVMLKALPQGATKVFAPTWMPLKTIDAIVLEKWPEVQKLHLALDAHTPKASPLADGSQISVYGRLLTLRLGTAARSRVRIQNDLLLLEAPESATPESLRATLQTFLSEQALQKIRERLNYYIPRMGVSHPNRVTIRNQKTRWGSCSSRHNLNFNWKLILAPPEALDYVVVHELCHFLEFSHSPRFWKLVERYFPEYSAWKTWLKLHGQTLNF